MAQKVTNLQKKVKYLMYMDGIQIFAKNEKELETLIQTIRIYSKDIGMEFGIERCVNNEKVKKERKEGIE